ncbi:uncharacterized protein LOC128961403 [Oppia nitens]|uniref:uncharacterized protein LOC128961403 n=1 Tax=Oppia nitens TaxID=1686743 RepID=UPI0023DA3D5C|nr:uncharacterized protein LOC128961403 [Oppia nitens]
MSSGIDFESLLLLNKAKKEIDIQEIMTDMIDTQCIVISVSNHVVTRTTQLLDNCTNESQVICLITNLSKLIQKCLKSDTDLTVDSINQIFPQTFDQKLKQILIKLIIKNSNNWLKNNKPIQSMSSLIDFQCKTEDNKCVIDLQLSDSNSQISVVLTRDQIHEMTEGMATIRQQLFDAIHKSN